MLQRYYTCSSTLPVYMYMYMYVSLSSQDNPGPDEAALVVTFIPPNGAKVMPSLFLSPRIERYIILYNIFDSL